MSFTVVIIWFMHNEILHIINPSIVECIFLSRTKKTQIIHGIKKHARAITPDKLSHNSFTLSCAAGGVEKAEKVMARVDLWDFHTDVQTT